MNCEDIPSTRQSFRNLADIITGDDSGYGLIFDALQKLNTLFIQSGAADPNAGMQPGTELANGYALSTEEAGRCMFDLARTVKFSRGLIKAIKHITEQHPHKTVRVLYAGCGPYALLAMLAIPYFDEGAVIFTAIDIHENSVNSAKKLTAALGFEKYFEEIIAADALQYIFSEKDILLVEVMQHALRKEPQVSVTAKLAAQLSENTVLIPECIIVKPGFTDLKKRDAMLHGSAAEDSASFEYESIAELDVCSARIAAADLKNPFPAKKIILEDSFLKPGYAFELFTTVKIWEDEILHGFDSAITLPFKIANGQLLAGKKSITFKYRNDFFPSFEWEAE